jgi:hypothetical protein
MAVESFLVMLSKSLKPPIETISSMFINLIPNLFIALLVLIVGYITGKIVGKFVYIILNKVLNIDGWFKRKRMGKVFYNIKVSNFFSALVKWYIYVLFIIQSIEIGQIPLLISFVPTLTVFFPKIFGAIFIFALGLIIGEVGKIHVIKFDIPLKKQAGDLTKLLIAYIGLVLSLQTLGLDVTILIEMFKLGFLALVLTFSIAFGIGLGFAFKDEIVDSFKEMKRKSRGKKQ